MHFEEQTEIETGFAAVFEEQLKPKLMAIETDRKELLRKAGIYMLIVLAVAGVLLAIIAQIWGGDAFFGYAVVGILGFVGAGGIWSIQSGKWQGSVEDVIMPAVCKHVGDLQFSGSGGSFDIPEMIELGLLQRYDSSSLKNRMVGVHHGTKYRIIQARLSRRTRSSKGGSKSTTIFDGLLFHVDVPAQSPGRILLMRDRGGFGNKLSEMFSFGGARAMPKVNFDHQAFEAAFEVYADQPDAAKAFMPPQFLDSMLMIGQDHGGGRGVKNILAGFSGNAFYMTLSRSGSFMKMGSLTKSVATMGDNLHNIFDDIALGHRIIDRLHGV